MSDFQYNLSGAGLSGLTLNYVTKAIAADNVGNSQIFDNGTSVGIGTAAPAASNKFEVVGMIKTDRINSGSNTVAGSQVHAIGETHTIGSGSSYATIIGGYSSTLNGAYICSVSGGQSANISGTNNHSAATSGILMPANTTNNSSVGGGNNTIFAGTSDGNDFVGARECIIDNNKSHNKIMAKNVYAQKDGCLYLSDNANIGHGYLSSVLDDQLVARFKNGLLFKLANNTTEVVIDNVGSVGIGTTAPDASCLLDLNSTTKGLGLSNLTNAQILAIPSPKKGTILLNTTINQVCFFDGTIWQKLNQTPM